MATKKKPAKKRATKTKATKKRATKTKATKKRATKAKPRDHIARAHRSIVRVLGQVDADDAHALAELGRLVTHAHTDARARRDRAR